ncbi:hypothetical protein OROMI_024364 [Orobanche minor]
MSFDRKRAIEQQLVQGSRKHGKVENQCGTLVLCFELLQEPRSSYVFEFFPIHDLLWNHHLHTPPDDDENMLLDDGSREKPIQTLHWGPPPKREDSSSSQIDLPYNCMSFLHTSSYDSSGGVLYAVGGLTPDDAFKASNYIEDQPFSLPTELTRISLLSGGDTVSLSKEDRKLSPMKSGKFQPLIEEIGGLIYVLSGYPPPLIKKPSASPEAQEGKEFFWFEVYDPRKDTWEQLEDPPFANSVGSVYSSPFFKVGKYRHLVVGNRLHVSDGMFACVYDTVTREWKASNLFTQRYLDKKVRGYPSRLNKWDFYTLCGWGGENCGLGFPFQGQPILLDEREKIYLCVKTVCKQGKPPLAAFQILGDSIDTEKAVRFPLVLTTLGLPYGYPRSLVHLGQDIFALLLIEAQEDWTEFYGTLVTFKLEFQFDYGVDGISTPCGLLATHLRVCYRKPIEANDVNPAYCFRM